MTRNIKRQMSKCRGVQLNALWVAWSIRSNPRRGTACCAFAHFTEKLFLTIIPSGLTMIEFKCIMPFDYDNWL